MLSDDELRRLLRQGEADHIERTQGVNDRHKFGESICAFANDLPDRRQVGVLFVGVSDNGDCAMAILEATPSDNPPVKFDGRVCVRIGPRCGLAIRASAAV